MFSGFRLLPTFCPSHPDHLEAETVAFRFRHVIPMRSRLRQSALPRRVAIRTSGRLSQGATRSERRDIRLQRRNRARFSRTSILLSTSKIAKNKPIVLIIMKISWDCQVFFGFFSGFGNLQKLCNLHSLTLINNPCPRVRIVKSCFFRLLGILTFA